MPFLKGHVHVRRYISWSIQGVHVLRSDACMHTCPDLIHTNRVGKFLVSHVQLGIMTCSVQCRCWLQGEPLSCLAYGHGNITACINDGLGDPMSEAPDPDAVDMAANVALVPIAVGRWPFLFIVAIEDIEAGTVRNTGNVNQLLSRCCSASLLSAKALSGLTAADACQMQHNFNFSLQWTT